jgi:hypothetical protein
MNEVDKLRVLIPHWIEHNEEHAGEFRRWAEEAGGETEDILNAADSMSRVNQSLAIALEKLGGASPHSHHEHHQ